MIRLVDLAPYFFLKLSFTYSKLSSSQRRKKFRDKVVSAAAQNSKGIVVNHWSALLLTLV
jgi:hypothetical protein